MASSHPDGASVWIAPGSQHICLVVDPGGGTAAFDCNSVAAAESGGLFVTLQGGPGVADQEDEIIGLAPDATGSVAVVLADGTAQSLRIDDGIYSARATGLASLRVGTGTTARSFAIAEPG